MLKCELLITTTTTTTTATRTATTSHHVNQQCPSLNSTLQEDDEEEEKEETLEENEATESVRLMGRSIRWRHVAAEFGSIGLLRAASSTHECEVQVYGFCCVRGQRIQFASEISWFLLGL